MAILSFLPTSPTTNNNNNNNKRRRRKRKSDRQSKTKKMIRSVSQKPLIPQRPSLNPTLRTVEECLLRFLPVRNAVWRTLEGDIGGLIGVLNDDVVDGVVVDGGNNNGGNGGGGATDEATWKAATKTSLAILKFLDSQRERLQPSFNLDESTMSTILKEMRGEDYIENLRYEILNLVDRISSSKEEEVMEARKKALMALAMVGELLVERFPYDVPKEKKYAFLPRLMGRARVTFMIGREGRNRKGRRGGGVDDVWRSLTGRGNVTSNTTEEEEDDNKQVVSNITIVADGFLAPITAGNFVDLSVRGFYTGLPVKYMKKRLGLSPLIPTWGGGDEAGVVDALQQIETAIEDLELGSSGGSSSGVGVGAGVGGGGGGSGSVGLVEEEDLGGSLVTTSLPIFGSFQEGFYDPLTAKPRRIPLEIAHTIQPQSSSSPNKNDNSNKPTPPDNQPPKQSLQNNNYMQNNNNNNGIALSYDTTNGFTSPDVPPSMSRTNNNNDDNDYNNNNSPAISFSDIDGLVAMNHPDRNPNGASSEFFFFTTKINQEEEERAKVASLLDGNYAPFGYVVEGLDLVKEILENNNSGGGDYRIVGTEVSEFGVANLVKVKGNSLEDIVGGEEED